MPKLSKSKRGFTLLEILLVVGIIAILAGVVIVAINPSRQLKQVRDVERKSDIGEINKAMTQFYIDYGYYPASTTLNSTSTPTEICATGDSSTVVDCDGSGLVDLSELVPVYLTSIPTDPQATGDGAGYKVAAPSTTKKTYVEAPDTELNGTGDSSVAYVGVIPSDYTPGDGGGGGDPAPDLTCADYSEDFVQDGSDCIATFTSSGTFTALQSFDAEVLVVAGGGGGGGGYGGGGGGGGGGLIYYGSESPNSGSSYPISAGSITVTVGDGGTHNHSSNPGNNGVWTGNNLAIGDDSIFDTLTALGGGAGGYEGHGSDGGSGGGGGIGRNGGDSIQTGGFGNNGGDSSANGGAGGGGAGAAGQMTNSGAAGAGGNGLPYSISGSSVYYGGGGAGGCSGGASCASGGLGGGASSVANSIGFPGTDGLGGGGSGGSDAYRNAGVGGSGIVIIRYTI